MSETDLRHWLANGLVVLGLAVTTIGIYGLAWLPDVYTRLHAAGKSVFLGVIPLLLATVLVGDHEATPHALLIAAFLLLTTPVSAHAIARAAYLAGERLGTADASDESGHLAPEQAEAGSEREDRAPVAARTDHAHTHAAGKKGTIGPAGCIVARFRRVAAGASVFSIRRGGGPVCSKWRRPGHDEPQAALS